MSKKRRIIESILIITVILVIEAIQIHNEGIRVGTLLFGASLGGLLIGRWSRRTR